MVCSSPRGGARDLARAESRRRGAGGRVSRRRRRQAATSQPRPRPAPALAGVLIGGGRRKRGGLVPGGRRGGGRRGAANVGRRGSSRRRLCRGRGPPVVCAGPGAPRRRGHCADSGALSGERRSAAGERGADSRRGHQWGGDQRGGDAGRGSVARRPGGSPTRAPTLRRQAAARLACATQGRCCSCDGGAAAGEGHAGTGRCAGDIPRRLGARSRPAGTGDGGCGAGGDCQASVGSGLQAGPGSGAVGGTVGGAAVGAMTRNGAMERRQGEEGERQRAAGSARRNM
mmetsp:Transcript_171209/g.548893  ORF Transcript_171209/g.548893 Transcript_171209/m.548893 type:complete len:286 (-) Transcript_171209:264-1121(-)